MPFIMQILLITVLVLFPYNTFSQDLFRQKETNPHYEQGDWISYSVGRFVSSVAVGQQYIYFGTLYSGIIRLDQYQFTWDYPWTTSNGLADNEIRTVAYDIETNTLWCASHLAISYQHPSSKKWYNFYKDEFGLPFDDEIVSIGIDRDKLYFESLAGRLFESDKYSGVFLVSNDRHSSDANIKWFGKRGQNRKQLPHFFMTGGYLFSPGRVADGVGLPRDGTVAAVEDFNFRRSEVVAAVEDDWGYMWIATWGAGAGRANVRSFRLDMYEFGLANQSVDALTFSGDDEIMWVAGSQITETNKGITAWNVPRQTWNHYEQRNISNILSDQVHAIMVAKEDVWFSTAFGLTKYSVGKGNWTTFDRFDGLSDNIVYDAVANDSAIWIATESGIDELQKNSLSKKDSVRIKPIHPDDLSLTRVRELELTQNLLWAATNSGIYVYDIRKREGGYSADLEGPVTNYVTTISSFENEIWFGSSKGIDVLDIEKREWLGVPEGRAFPNTHINKILAAKGAVWAGTDEGVLKYDRKTKAWRKFTVEDGLLNDRVYAIALDGDYIWFGTEGGITQFYWNDPSRID